MKQYLCFMSAVYYRTRFMWISFLNIFYDRFSM